MSDCVAMIDKMPIKQFKSSDNDLPAGYKRTEVGVIPEDWNVFRIGEIASVSSGGTPSRSNLSYWNGTIPWTTTSQIEFNTITVFEEYITQDGLRNSAAKLFPIGTILMAMYGQGKTRGKVALLGCEASINQACAAIQIKKDTSLSYVFYCLVSKYNAIRKLSNAGNQENLNSRIVKSIQIPLPNAEEQQAIAAALSDADALIASLDKLIAKKRDMKTAAMQQLLTGRQRLPGFSGEWESCVLSELGDFFKGRGIRRDEVVSEGIPCIRYGEIYTRYNDYTKELHSFIPIDVAKQSQRIQQGYLLFAGSGETAEEIGKCVAYLGDHEAYAGGDIVIFTPHGQDAMFLGYLMNHASIISQKARMGQGDAVVHISARNLGQLQVWLPSIEEQVAIATVLSDMDAEITALETRRDKMRAIKQGMMQELLTGRTRLV